MTHRIKIQSVSSMSWILLNILLGSPFGLLNILLGSPAFLLLVCWTSGRHLWELWNEEENKDGFSPASFQLGHSDLAASLHSQEIPPPFAHLLLPALG